MAALQFVDVPGYAALLFRRTYADLALPGALMDRAHDWLAGTAACWHAHDHYWSFPSGASLSFGYLESANDKYRYQSAEFAYIGFDELTQFEESSISLSLQPSAPPQRIAAAAAHASCLQPGRPGP